MKKEIRKKKRFTRFDGFMMLVATLIVALGILAVNEYRDLEHQISEYQDDVKEQNVQIEKLKEVNVELANHNKELETFNQEISNTLDTTVKELETKVETVTADYNKAKKILDSIKK